MDREQDIQKRKTERLESIIRRLSAEFLNRESTGPSLVTVTEVVVSPDRKNANIYISIFPPENESKVLEFAKRKRSDLREYIEKNVRIRLVPMVDMEIDRGEKNRRKIDDILRMK